MRKAVIGTAVLLMVSLQSGKAQTLTTAPDYAAGNSDVVLESAVKDIKAIPQDTVNVVGDGVKFVSDETVSAVNGVKAAFKADPVAKVEKTAALEVANAWNSANDVTFRSYKVSESVGNELMTGKNVEPGTSVDVSGYFTCVEFPKGTSAMYRPEFKRLFVRQTLSNMLCIEDVLADQSNAKRELMGKQFEIQTKFVEVNQSTLNELGFNWRLDSSRSFNGLTLPAQDILSSGLRTAGRVAPLNAFIPGFDGNKTAAFGAAVADSATLGVQKTTGSFRWTMVIDALEQSDNADVLSAPSITTRDGKTANIWVGEQRMVPKSFSTKSQNTGLYAENSDWESQLMGVQLEVTPELRKGGLIDLELKPKVLDLIGYDDYQITPSNVVTTVYAGNAGTVTVIPGTAPAQFGSLPYFRTREITTQVTVADGNTVAMGGLVYDKLETYKDKVPVLGSIPLIGRLFRSEGEKSIKRNLMIFVTATEVDVNGRRSADLAMKK